MRGSDPDAAVYYLAAMLEGGEDPRFLARRIVIAASEDVGNADPRALLVAVAAAQAVEHVGLPEAQLNLAQAAIYVARAPKSNAAARAIWNARADVRREGIAAPPATLRDAHYRGAADRGHGEGYVSPHEDPSRAGIDHLPESVRGRAYYVPSANGEEAEEALGGDRDG
jgi:putative ATPase